MKIGNKFLLAALLIIGACSTAPGGPGLSTDAEPIDTSPAAQAEYKKAWLEAVTNKVFKNENANVFGGGGSSFFSVFAFDAEGNLHNTGSSLGTWFSLHRVIAFKSTNQAVVMFYKSASGAALGNEVYALEIRNDTIYRTENIRTASTGNPGAHGFTTIDRWDGKSYSSEKIALFAPIDKTISYPALKVPATNS